MRRHQQAHRVDPGGADDRPVPVAHVDPAAGSTIRKLSSRMSVCTRVLPPWRLGEAGGERGRLLEVRPAPGSVGPDVVPAARGSRRSPRRTVPQRQRRRGEGLGDQLEGVQAGVELGRAATAARGAGRRRAPGASSTHRSSSWLQSSRGTGSRRGRRAACGSPRGRRRRTAAGPSCWPPSGTSGAPSAPVSTEASPGVNPAPEETAVDDRGAEAVLDEPPDHRRQQHPVEPAGGLGRAGPAPGWRGPGVRGRRGHGGHCVRRAAPGHAHDRRGRWTRAADAAGRCGRMTATPASYRESPVPTPTSAPAPGPDRPRDHPELLHHRAHRPRQVDAGRPDAAADRRGRRAQRPRAVPRPDGHRARARHHDQEPGRPDAVDRAGRQHRGRRRPAATS